MHETEKDFRMPQTQIFDGHNDTILSLLNTGRSFYELSEEGHVDLPRAKSGGLAGGFFAVWVPDPGIDPLADGDATKSPYANEDSRPEQMSQPYAERFALEALGQLHKLERESNGTIGIVRTADELRDNLAQDRFSIELHFEGAEPIDPELKTLEGYYLAGMRSLGLVWSRSNAFAHGVPFQFPGSPDTGPGLTDPGKALVRACNELGIIIDNSHLNEAGFWDVARISQHPLVATHSGAHALSPSTRNLTDKQLDAIRDSDGLVGVNFHVGFLHPEGNGDAEATSVAGIADHLDYLMAKLGDTRVALGSDFDGATMPADLADSAGLPLLVNELQSRGYDQPTLDQIGTKNWLRIFDQTWAN
jgi:membrane dipeptidase